MKKSTRTPKLGPDETTLFDAAMGMVEQLKPTQKQQIGRIFLFLLACAEDEQLNMNKVAMLLTKMDIGVRFDV